MKKISKIAIKFSGIVSALILVIMLMMSSLILKQTKDSLIKEMQIRAEFFARDVRESLFPTPDAFNLYFAAQEMGKENFVTMGRIYKTVMDKERSFEYGGEDVEAIPHITDENKKD